MFSSDDIGRGPRFPLLWLIGPLVLGGLVVTGLGILAAARRASRTSSSPTRSASRLALAGQSRRSR